MENTNTKMSQNNKISQNTKVNKTRKNDLYESLNILSENNLKTMEELNNYQEDCWEEVNNCLSGKTRELLEKAYGIDYGDNGHTRNQIVRVIELNSCEISIYKLKQTFDEKTGQPTNKPRIYKI
jgi:hypothetical protein